MLWWPLFTLLGTLWWLVPLFLLGAYSPPFLDFIETAAVTTFPTTLFDALRGTSNWVPYVDPDCTRRQRPDHVGLPARSTARSSCWPVSRAWPCGATRTGLFLVLGRRASGSLLVTMGHHGAVQGWFARSCGTLLDGALAPLRNVHKFDPVHPAAAGPRPRLRARRAAVPLRAPPDARDRASARRTGPT